ncbi:MAG TPA: glucose-6-phosphate dehydrogenase assembly protein OpcA [Vicinamibacterales bacterium]|jgi:glucose-6-phosphate dehydrogenase assembly protein OpcA
MASALVDRAWRESTPESVEADLAALWRDVSKRGPIAHAVMSNLVVFRLHERRSGDRSTPVVVDDDLLSEVAARHPSRAIVIEHDRGEHDARSPVGASVGISVFGSESAAYGVEWVVVRSASAEQSLPSIVLRFAQGDVPTSVWWTEDLSTIAPLPALVSSGRQLVYDSGRWRDVAAGIRTLVALLNGQELDLADVNWRRLTSFRQALAHVSRTLPRDITADRIRITHRADERALAWLLAGWLAARLSWSPTRWPAVDAVSEGDELLKLEIDGGKLLTATLGEHRVEMIQPGKPPLVVAAPCPARAEQIAAELRELASDAGLVDAVKALGRHLDRAQGN